MPLQIEDYTWLFINFAIITPIAVYYTILFRDKYKRGDTILSLRRPRLVAFTLIGSIYYICFHQSIYILSLGFLNSVKDRRWEFLFDSIGYQICFALYFWRSWHIYFDLAYNRLSADHFWKSILDENYSSTPYEQRGFIKYKTSLGNPKKTKYIILLYIILYSITLSLAVYLTPNHMQRPLFPAECVAVIFIAIFALPFLYFFYHINTTYDSIYLRREILVQSICMLFCLVLEIVVIIVMNALPQHHRHRYKGDDRVDHIELLLECILPSLALFINILMSTAYVFYKQKQESDRKNALARNTFINEHFPVASTPKLFSKWSFGTNTETEVVDDHVPLMVLLQDKYGMKLFCDHLVKEIAVEHLLFVIEVEQYKKYCIEQRNHDEEEEEEKYEERQHRRTHRRTTRYMQDLIEFYPTMPKSKIVENPHCNLKDKYIALYEKYVDSVKASFEVNISALSRKQLLRQYRKFDNQRIKKSRDKTGQYTHYDVIGERDIHEILESFNGALKDVKYALNDSYSRFYGTNVYFQWHKEAVLKKKRHPSNAKSAKHSVSKQIVSNGMLQRHNPYAETLSDVEEP